MDLAVHLEHAVKRFSRYHKYTLGSELRQTAQKLCQLITRSARARESGLLSLLDELVFQIEDMKTLLTLAQETRAFARFDDFAQATELAVVLGKQSGGWRRGVNRVNQVRGPLHEPARRMLARTRAVCRVENPRDS